MPPTTSACPTAPRTSCTSSAPSTGTLSTSTATVPSTTRSTSTPWPVSPPSTPVSSSRDSTPMVTASSLVLNCPPGAASSRVPWPPTTGPHLPLTRPPSRPPGPTPKLTVMPTPPTCSRSPSSSLAHGTYSSNK